MVLPQKNIITLSITLLTALLATFILTGEARAEVVVENRGVGKFGVIKGVVRDKKGNPISEATVAIFRVGTSKLLKQVTATKKGKFFARIIPGTYTVLAVAQGYNPVTLDKVKVNRAAELSYGFNLERVGKGRTLPEKRADSKSPRTAVRAASRSIYQADEGEKPLVAEENIDLAATVEGEENAVAESIGIVEDDEEVARKGQTAIETYFAGTKNGGYTGVNFATLQPLGEKAEVVFAGQYGTGNAPKRFETSLNFRPNNKHQIRLKGSVADIGEVKIDEQNEDLGQISFQALDQWRVREGIVVVFGLDYSRFIGAGDDYSFSPRIGFQYDLDSRTRVRTAYTTQNEERTWQRALELEGSQILFREPVAVEDIAFEEDRPQMNKSSRLEFGIERVLDNRSTVEANVFFDTVMGRGVGLINLPFDTLSDDGFSHLVANQQGKAQGFRVVYNRRLNGVFSASTGYAFGSGQRLSPEAISNPANVFETDFFHTVFGQVNADLKTGTSIRTIFRFSPEATVFAIDPFQGRLAIYDPSLSIMITQNLPSWGLPIDAEAILDARNLFDYQSGVNSDEGSLILNSHRRILRGGILVRF
jgi:hypothetical protein